MEDLYPYYERELLFIRQMAAEFAANHPATAAKLRLEKDRSADPHVERLIEAFALIAARVQHKIDDEFPEITESLLGVLYPHYLRPIPSMSIAQFQPDPTVSAATAGTRVDPGIMVYTRPPENVCSFRTCYPVDVRPLRIASATFESPSSLGLTRTGEFSTVLRLELRATGTLPLHRIQIPRLRIYLDGNRAGVNTLYEYLFVRTRRIVLRPLAGPSSPPREFVLPADALQPVGLNPGEGLLPYPENSFLGYRLLQEYIHFPKKFHFVDLQHLQPLASPDFAGGAEILICLAPSDRPERMARLEQSLHAEMFQLGCTPIINLFDRASEPIRLSQTATEYRVIADQHRQSSTEIYSINRVTSTSPNQEKPEVFEPLYSIRHAQPAIASRRFWYAHRRPAIRKEDPGTEMFLTLVDLDFQPSLPASEMLTAYVTCTNRDVPASLKWDLSWGELEVEGKGALRVRSLTIPSPTLRPPLRGGLQWRLISHLSLNHLSLVEGGLPALKEILRLYDFSASEEDRAVNDQQIAGLVELSCQPSTGRMQSRTGVTFCRGTDVTMKFDEQKFLGTGVYLLASVLERFFGLYASINSFSRFSARTSQGVLKQWPPLAGAQTIL